MYSLFQINVMLLNDFIQSETRDGVLHHVEELINSIGFAIFKFEASGQNGGGFIRFNHHEM